MRRESLKKTLLFRSISFLIISSFLFSAVTTPPAYAQSLNLPAPGSMVMTSPAFMPVMMKGLKVHPDNPLLFDFILDTGKTGYKIDGVEFKAESERLIKYFLASLTIKEDDLWVNLSPYEKDRMITEELGQTELGRDMLAQDYILKQLTSSLIYPEKELGKKFWDKVYAKAQEQFGTTDIPVDTFNKVWIVADKAKVLERNNVAYVVGSHLKVMLESDYKAAQTSEVRNLTSEVRNLTSEVERSGFRPGNPTAYQGGQQPTEGRGIDQAQQELAKQIIREVIIPEIEKEVNEGQNFAPLRQMFYSMILASWYKLALKDALLNQVYSNKAKTSGVLSDDPAVKDKIYAQYLEAFKVGAFNYIKEETDSATKQVLPRKYFSGGERINVPEVLERAQILSAGDDARKIGDMAQVEVRVDQLKIKNPDVMWWAGELLPVTEVASALRAFLADISQHPSDKQVIRLEKLWRQERGYEVSSALSAYFHDKQIKGVHLYWDQRESIYFDWVRVDAREAEKIVPLARAWAIDNIRKASRIMDKKDEAQAPAKGSDAAQKPAKFKLLKLFGPRTRWLLGEPRFMTETPIKLINNNRMLWYNLRKTVYSEGITLGLVHSTQKEPSIELYLGNDHELADSVMRQAFSVVLGSPKRSEWRPMFVNFRNFIRAQEEARRDASMTQENLKASDGIIIKPGEEYSVVVPAGRVVYFYEPASTQQEVFNIQAEKNPLGGTMLFFKRAGDRNGVYIEQYPSDVGDKIGTVSWKFASDGKKIAVFKSQRNGYRVVVRDSAQDVLKLVDAMQQDLQNAEVLPADMKVKFDVYRGLVKGRSYSNNALRILLVEELAAALTVEGVRVWAADQYDEISLRWNKPGESVAATVLQQSREWLAVKAEECRKAINVDPAESFDLGLESQLWFLKPYEMVASSDLRSAIELGFSGECAARLRGVIKEIGNKTERDRAVEQVLIRFFESPEKQMIYTPVLRLLMPGVVIKHVDVANKEVFVFAQGKEQEGAFSKIVPILTQEIVSYDPRARFFDDAMSDGAMTGAQALKKFAGYFIVLGGIGLAGAWAESAGWISPGLSNSLKIASLSALAGVAIGLGVAIGTGDVTLKTDRWMSFFRDARGSQRKDSAALAPERRKEGREWLNDSGLTMPGGIDLNGSKMGLDVAKDGKGVQIKVDPAMVAEFQKGNFTGVQGIILKIVPVESPLLLLGLNADGTPVVV